MNYKSSISIEEINSLPLFKLASENIIVIDNIDDFNKIKECFLSEKIWGIDVETKPVFEKKLSKYRKPALLQISGKDKTYLIRINKIGIPKELIDFLTSTEILKIGLALKNDLIDLCKISRFKPQGFIDLQDIVKDFGIEELGLKKLAAIVLGYRISKKQQTSNWESEILNEKQIEYAATDSFVTREIYINLYKYDRASI